MDFENRLTFSCCSLLKNILYVFLKMSSTSILMARTTIGIRKVTKTLFYWAYFDSYVEIIYAIEMNSCLEWYLSSGSGLIWPKTLQYAKCEIWPISLAVSSLVIALLAMLISASVRGGAAETRANMSFLALGSKFSSSGSFSSSFSSTLIYSFNYAAGAFVFNFDFVACFEWSFDEIEF